MCRHAVWSEARARQRRGMLAGQEPGAEPGLRQRRQRAVAQLGGRGARGCLRRAAGARRARGVLPRLKPRMEPGPDQAGQRCVAAGRGRGRVRRRIEGVPCAGSSWPGGLAGRRAWRACRASGARPLPTRRRLCCARPGPGLRSAPGLACVRVPRGCGAVFRAAAPPRRRLKQPGRQRRRRRRWWRRHPPVACVVPRRGRTFACLLARPGRPMLGGRIPVARRTEVCLGLSVPRGTRAAAGGAGGHAAQRLLQCVEQKLVALGPAACAAPKGVPLHVQCLFCATQRGRCLAQLSSFPQRPACAHACFAGCARVHIGKKESWAQGVTDALLLRLVTTGGLATKHDEARELRGRSRP